MFEDFLPDQGPVEPDGGRIFISESRDHCVPVKSRTLARAIKQLGSNQGEIRTDCEGAKDVLVYFTIDTDGDGGWVGVTCGGYRDLCGWGYGYQFSRTDGKPTVTRTFRIDE